VLPHPLLRLFRILPPERLDDVPVLSQGRFHSIRKSPGGESKDTNMIMEAGHQLDEPAGIREGNDALVKLEVLPGIALDVFLAERFFEAPDAGFQPGQTGVRYPLRSQASGQSFKVFADEE